MTVFSITYAVAAPVMAVATVGLAVLGWFAAGSAPVWLVWALLDRCGSDRGPNTPGGSGMRIGELAAAAGVSTRALRHYEHRGLLRSDRQPNGYRSDDESAVTRVRNIRALLDAGLNTEHIRELSSCLDADLAHVPARHQAVAVHRRRLRVVRSQLAVLRQVERHLEDGRRHLGADR